MDRGIDGVQNAATVEVGAQICTISSQVNDIPGERIDTSEAGPSVYTGCWSQLRSSYGVILSGLGALSYSWTILATNQLQQYDYFVLGMYESVFLIIPCLMYTSWYQIDLFPRIQLKRLIFRGVAGYLGSVFIFITVRALPVSESATFIQMTPVFVSLIGCIFLKEKCSVFTTIVILMTMLGVICVANPVQMVNDIGHTSVIQQLIGISSALCGNVIYACTIIVIRQLRTVNPSVVIIYLGSVTFIVAITGCLWKNELRVPNNMTDFALLMSIGLGYLGGQLGVSTALRYESSIVVSMVQISQVFFCTLYQLFILKDPISLLKGTGVVIIVLNVLMLGFQRYILGRPLEDPLRKKFFCLLR